METDGGPLCQCAELDIRKLNAAQQLYGCISTAVSTQLRNFWSRTDEAQHCANTAKQLLDGVWCSPVDMTFLLLLVKGHIFIIDLTARGLRICLGLSCLKLIISLFYLTGVANVQQSGLLWVSTSLY